MGGLPGPPPFRAPTYRGVVTTKDDIREFLISRRANVTPAQAGIHGFGGERRVPGLRREEVAELAGVSLDYYTRLERGNIRGASRASSTPSRERCTSTAASVPTCST